MAKAIRFTYADTEYVLQFTKRTVQEMEQQGFLFREVPNKPMTYLPMFFKGAFLANHRGIKVKLVDEIYDALANKEALLGALTDLYEDTLAGLMDEPEEGNPNVSWTLS